PDGAVLHAAVLSGPSHGALVLNANGSFTYTPTSTSVLGYSGPDSFTYTATGDRSEARSVGIAISARSVNDQTAADDSFTVAEHVVLNGHVLANDSTLDGAVLHAAVVSGPSHGALVLNANGSFTYTPTSTSVLGYSGPDSFTYTATGD